MPIRKDILDAAAQVFDEKGYERAVLEDIAKLVGIQKGSLYHHIDSKQQLLFEIHEQLSAEVWRATEEAIESSDVPSEQLRAIILALMRLIAQRGADVGVFLRDYRALTGRNWKRVVKRRREYRGLIEGVISRGIEVGEFRSLSPTVVALGVLGMANWTHEWFNPDGPDSADEIGEMFASLVLDGVRDPS